MPPTPGLYEQIKSGAIRVQFHGPGASPPEVRFWACVNKDGPVHPTLGTKCWLWSGKSGSIRRRCQILVDGAAVKVTRYSWTIHYGEAPNGLEVCHRCDNPLCINPAHLFIATHQGNMADMVAKRRQATGANGRNGHITCPDSTPRGERHPRARLTAAQVREIRYRHSTGQLDRAALAREFGVSADTIYRIARRYYWRSVE